MDKEEIIRMAQEVDAVTGLIGRWIFLDAAHLERFAALVAAHERENCVADCMEQHRESINAAEKTKRIKDQDAYINTATGAKFSAIRIQQRAAAIRART